MTSEEVAPVTASSQSIPDGESTAQEKYRLYQILAQQPEDYATRQLLRQIAQNNSSSFLQDKQKFLVALEKEYQAIYKDVITMASLGWRYCLGIDSAFIDPSLQAILPKKQLDINQEIILPKAPHTASQYLEQILSITDIQTRWHYVNELVMAQNNQLLLDDFADISDLELSNSLKQTLGGGKLNILILGAGCVGLALANTLKTSLGELVNILVIENRIQAKHIKKPYTRNWLTNLSNPIYEDFFDPRVVTILREFGNGDYMGVPLNILETLLFLANRAQGVRFYFTNSYKLSLINGTETDMVIDATGGKLNFITSNDQDNASFAVNLSACREFGRKYSGFAITNFDDMPNMRLIFDQKGSFFYPSFEEKQLKSAMFKLTNVPLELYDQLLAHVQKDNRDGLIYVWPGKLRRELNSLLILINLSSADYHQLGRFLTQKTDLHSFMMAHGRDLHLDQRILDFFEQIRERDTQKASYIEPPFLYEPYIRILPEKLPRIFGCPVFRLGDSVFNGHPKVGNGLGSHLNIVGKFHDAILALS
jgi:hypothetical protein